MSTKRKSRLAEIFSAALDLPTEERSRFIHESCGDDEKLAEEVMSLLAHDNAAHDGFLGLTEEDREGGPRAGPAKVPLIGQVIGGYQIESVVASGGVGTVYRAQQAKPQRTVAIKVLHRGIASPKALRRFELEPELLARLRHPHIAQIIEAGVHRVPDADLDIPYFVLEYLPEAQSITAFADQRKLNTEDRLRLFLSVCDAIQYAHQQGIIHRDLKPSNILVDNSGQVKVIDFGVARVTDADLAMTTMQTEVGQLIGTLQYMSPEQCAADPQAIDTRCDVYALGVVLYELLARQLPYSVDQATIQTAARIICEVPPNDPASLDRDLRGDLSAILLKALAKDRAKRYQSVGQLADDIRSHLDGTPISARMPTSWVRAIRWVARHPVYASSAMSVSIALLVILATYFAVYLVDQRPYALELSTDHRQVRLMTRTGRELCSWRAAGQYGFAGDFRKGRLIADMPNRLGVVGFPSRYPGELAASISAFAVDEGEYEDPQWCNRIIDTDLPAVLGDDGVTGSMFNAGVLGCYDIFPESPGHEIVAMFAHDTFSPRAIRIIDQTGRTRFQIWHDGSVGNCYHMAKAGLLVFTGDNSEARWEERGVVGALDYAPQVLFAIAPTVDTVSRDLPSESERIEMPSLAWYRCLRGPVDKVQVRLANLREPSGLYSAEEYILVSIDIVHPVFEDRPSISLVVDAQGREVPGARVVGDDFQRYRDELPLPSGFFLGDLPSIITTDAHGKSDEVPGRGN